MITAKIVKPLWNALCICWVLAPIFGWLPEVHPRLATLWWWTLLSIPVLILGQILPNIHMRSSILISLLLFTFLAHIAFITDPYSTAWIGQMLIIGLAGLEIAHKQDVRILFDALVLAAMLQIPFMLFQAMGHESIYLRAGGDNWPMSGSVTRRAFLGTLFAAASFAFKDWRGWALSILSCLTGSWTGGAVAITRMSLPYVKRLGMIGLMAAASFLIATFQLWQGHFGIRWAVWTDLSWLALPFGHGFGLLPGGFNDASLLGGLMNWRDYHSTFIDTVARTGILGITFIGFCTTWLWRNFKYSFWPCLFLGWVCFWQSLEASAVLSVIVFILVVCIEQKREAYESV